MFSDISFQTSHYTDHQFLVPIIKNNKLNTSKHARWCLFFRLVNYITSKSYISIRESKYSLLMSCLVYKRREYIMIKAAIDEEYNHNNHNNKNNNIIRSTTTNNDLLKYHN
jgi:hypothetical protein